MDKGIARAMFHRYGYPPFDYFSPQYINCVDHKTDKFCDTCFKENRNSFELVYALCDFPDTKKTQEFQGILEFNFCYLSNTKGSIYLPTYSLDRHKIVNVNLNLDLSWLFLSMQEKVNRKSSTEEINQLSLCPVSPLLCATKEAEKEVVKIIVQHVLIPFEKDYCAITFICSSHTPKNIYASIDFEGKGFRKILEISPDTVWIGDEKCAYMNFVPLNDQNHVIYDVLNEKGKRVSTKCWARKK